MRFVCWWPAISLFDEMAGFFFPLTFIAAWVWL